ncbi:hypothetical protein CASFOL_019785 [Castilleja foliolosa]|uniref:Uncharacterized protein n=1 Tax=Castilleja foliolosa TaxID=1961234 RepID=A0ABD3CZT7_9LAMI
MERRGMRSIHKHGHNPGPFRPESIRQHTHRYTTPDPFANSEFELELILRPVTRRHFRASKPHNNFLNSSFTTGISKLKSLNFFNAQQQGPLPEELVYLKNLEYLNSYFEGAIPSSYGEFPKLKSLYLSGNLLTGWIPGQLGFSTQLEHVELAIIHTTVKSLDPFPVYRI